MIIVIAHVLVEGNITAPNTGTAEAPNNKSKKVIFKNFASSTGFTSEINNTEIDHAKDIDVIMAIFNVI